MHVVIALMFQNKLWRYLLLTSPMLLHDVIMTSYCCQRYACAKVELLHQKTPNFLASNLWPPNSPDLSPVDYEIWVVMQHRVYHR